MKSFWIVPAAAVLCLLATNAAETPADQTQLLWEHRNLGKAFYENPDTHVQAMDQLRAALEISHAVRDRVNYGLALLLAGQTEAGMNELLRAQKEDPTLPHTWFNLGIAYKRAGEYDKALEQLRGMVRVVPNDATGHYNIGAVLRAQGDVKAALPEFLEAARLNPDLAGPHFQLFTLYQRAGDHDNAARERKLFEDAKRRNEGSPTPEDMEWSFYSELYDPPEPRMAAENEPTKYDDHAIGAGWNRAESGMLAIDAEGTGHADLLVWSNEKVALYRHGMDEAKNSGLEGLRDVQTIAAGDYDNDGLADLCVVTARGATIFHNDHGKFSKLLDVPETAGVTAALWLDYDHDYDLDLLLFGLNPVLMRNEGNGKFENRTEQFPFVKGHALSAVAFAMRGDTAARDVVVSYADRVGVLYTDKLNEVFETTELPQISAETSMLDAQDFNHDGLMDVVSYRPEIYGVRNDAGILKLAENVKTAPGAVRADFNGDSREDYARILPDGSLHVYTNASPEQKWVTIRIEGTKNIKEAVDATVEVKSGAFYTKRIYQGVPLAFATDGRSEVDAVRITWPNGLIQNETRKKSSEALVIPEAQRLSGSCPMIFTWDGEQYEFITDVLGVAPLGATSGDGTYFPVDHQEFIQIPGKALKLVDGKYRIHITEELREVSYMDQVQLMAVDHPEGTEIYTNEKFKSPPYPEFRLFGAKQKIHAVRATDDGGRDVRAQLEKLDQTYPDKFAHNTSGVAELHTLTLDFGKAAAPGNRAALVLNGWVDWADGSTFMGVAQGGKGGLIFPYVQVKDAAGEWKTVVPDMGMPSGKPKSMVVDLTGKFLSASREARIVTNLCLYWDEIFLIDDASAPEVKLTKMNAESAELAFRGFSKPVIDPTRQQPEKFLYNEVQPVSNWNPTPGFYTRYGDVRPLVNAVDDELVVMGSGDEMRLEYSAAGLPDLPQGWTRDFILLVDGWAKDADANTAFGQSVMPLPFHAMSAYPYRAGEHFPNDAEHEKYLHDYLTRPALRLIRPLGSGTATN